MKNHSKDAASKPKRCTLPEKILLRKTKNKPRKNRGFGRVISLVYFFTYITSFTNFTVLATSGNAAATRLGA